VTPVLGTSWVRADSNALARGVVHLLDRLHAQRHVEAVTLTVGTVGGYAALELSWAGEPVAAEEFGRWLDEPLHGGAAPDVRELVARHGGEVWSGGDADERPHLKLLLPLVEAGSAGVPTRTSSDVEARPEFYDFDLFDRRVDTRDWSERRLDELTYTVFDTETTGLSPTEGDEIISVGAIRVVNGRLLHQESFERLVDPQRGVPEVSTAVHGLTREMLRGRPTIDTVLPDFARYAADSVLVGHNVSFDLTFLRLKEDRTGVRLTQPSLDTLLLDALLHPDHEEHSLEAIATRLGIEVVGRHTALGDALVTGEVFLRLLTLLQRRGFRTLGEVIEASRTTLQARVDRRIYDS
jgi:DNA polymerase-3 subunit epsilon